MVQTLQHLPSVDQKGPDRINPRIFLLALGMFALGTDAFVIAGVLPVIAKGTGVPEALAGQLVTAFSLVYGLGAPLLAALTGRWSPNRVLVGAIGLFCLVSIASSLAPAFPFLVFTRILTGCVAASYAPLAYTIGTSLAPPEKRGQALGLVLIGLAVATVIGAPLGTWVGENFGWRLSFVLVAGLSAIAFLALLLVGLPRTVAPSTLSLKTRLAPITQPRIVLALLPALVWNLGAYTVYTYIAPLLQHTLHIAAISALLVVFGLGALSGTLLGGRVADRFGENRPLLIFLVVLVIVEVAFSLAAATLIGALLALFVLGLLLSILIIPQQHRLLRLAPEHANVILALNNSTIYLGMAGGAALGGLALHSVAVTQLGWIGAICALLALAFFAVSLRLSERKTPVCETGCAQKEDVLMTPE
jgi:DHA1 family inner membrane transport protein